ncbi:protelomerase family protein [Richelia sinica]|uniref:protelomerase family protein n=1 Tax=Richelia sinica TaxID=1357545 RepID=UPI00168926AD|nr:protelomerase family protein [Richelia sinica]MBD2667392.1 hypothetical protein [Richelia sinica FACHB-800]
MSRELKTADELENGYVDERLKYLLPELEALTPYKVTERKKGKGKLIGWEQLAVREARLLKINYPDDKPEDEKTYPSAYRQSQAIKKALRSITKDKLQDPMVINQFKTIVTNFSNALTFLFSEYKNKTNIKYRENVEDRSQEENRIQIDLTNSLKYAYNILTEIKQEHDNGITPEKSNVNWLDVSCAISLATGRRMAEVHLSAEFKKVDDYSIIFTGQLKGKSRRVKVADKAVKLIDAKFTIPTLINSDLLIFGLDWLDKKGKRFDCNEDPERVNRRFSKTLNLRCKDFDIFPEDERTYHKFRAAYFTACVKNRESSLKHFDFTKYASAILGDEDEKTINSYKRYEIKQGTLTKI